MKKIVIAGAEHTGKSTLLDRLRTEFSHNVYFIPEPASQLIAEENRKRELDQSYEGVYPTNNYRMFAELVMAKSVELENAIPPHFKVAVLDRSLIDNIAYARLIGCEDLIPRMRSLARNANYATVLMCDFVGTYTQTPIRSIDEATARRLHKLLHKAYSEFEANIIHLPPVDVESRATMIRPVIEAALSSP